MKLKHLISLGLLSIIILCTAESCEGPANPIAIEVNTITNVYEARFTVSKVGEFRDDVAYRDKRYIYHVRDNATKKEFIGITGVGIAEVGTHSDGDDTVKDER